MSEDHARLMYAPAPLDEERFEMEVRHSYDERNYGPCLDYYHAPKLSFGVEQIASGPLRLLEKYKAVLERHSMRPSYFWVGKSRRQSEEPCSLLLLDWREDRFTEGYVIAKRFTAFKLT